MYVSDEITESACEAFASTTDEELTSHEAATNFCIGLRSSFTHGEKREGGELQGHLTAPRPSDKRVVQGKVNGGII